MRIYVACDFGDLFATCLPCSIGCGNRRPSGSASAPALATVAAPAEFQLNAHKFKISNNFATCSSGAATAERDREREGDGDGEYKTLPDTQETQAEDTTQLLPALFGPTTRRRDPLPASGAPTAPPASAASARSQLKNLCAY